MVVVECGVELVRPMDPATIDDHHNLFTSFAEGCHHLMEILTQSMGIKVRHDFIEDFRRSILDCTNDVEQDAAGDPTPRAILQPRLALETLVALDLAVAEGAHGQARALRFAPPACPR